MNIRKAKPGDREAWAALRSRLWPDSASLHIRDLEDYFAGKSVDVVQAYVLESDAGDLTGFIELNIRNYAEGSRSPRIPYIEGWYVAESCRGKGYGRKLIRVAEQWALKQGYRELASDAELANHESIAIHERLGFEETERVVCFLKKLK